MTTNDLPDPGAALGRSRAACTRVLDLDPRRRSSRDRRRADRSCKITMPCANTASGLFSTRSQNRRVGPAALRGHWTFLRTARLVARAAAAPRLAAGRREGRVEAASAVPDGRCARCARPTKARHGSSPAAGRTRSANRTPCSTSARSPTSLPINPATVCVLHRGLAEGIVEGVGGARVERFVAKDPYRAGCRVGLRRTT